MALDKMYKAALELIEQGQTVRARDMFTRLLRSDSSKAEYWLWMSTLVDTQQERVYCLESALRVDPDNESAKRGLIILGARPAGKDVSPVPPMRRNWEKEIEDVVEPSSNFVRRFWDNRLLRFGSLFAAVIFIIIIVLSTRPSAPKQPEQLEIYKVSPFPTYTPAPTLSPTATRTLVIRSPTPTFLGPTPLWMFLSATYTPMPIYVNTPHPMVEAYRAGMRAFERSDWTSVLGYMDQAVTAEPNSPDLYYYTAEAYRMLGKLEDAVKEYGHALEVDPKFAPAYLGRALAYEKINPKADIEGELNYAIQYDPNYVDAYLNRARIRIIHKNPQGALEDLIEVDKLFPSHPMMFVLLAQAYLQLNDLTAALDNALYGYQLDQTSLPAYLTLAKVYLATKDPIQAIHYINIYLAYASDDANGWAVKAQAQYEIGVYAEALIACDRGIAADEENAPSWYYCGIIHLDQGDIRTAVNELVMAVNLDLQNFDYSVALGKALWADERLNMAARQFNSAELLAATDSQLAIVYYNRAMVYEQALSLSKAMTDWKLLLALPPEQVPEDWRLYATEHLSLINPPTPTDTPTRTRIPTQTSTPTLTPVPSVTVTPTMRLIPTMVSTIYSYQTSTPVGTAAPSLTPVP